MSDGDTKRNAAAQLRSMATERGLLASGLGFPDPLLVAADLLDPPDYDGQLCDKCGGPDEEVWFCHDPKLWEMVTGNPKPPGTENAKGLMCIRCFDKATRELGIWVEWAPLNFQHLTFSAHPSKKPPPSFGGPCLKRGGSNRG